MTKRKHKGTSTPSDHIRDLNIMVLGSDSFGKNHTKSIQAQVKNKTDF